MFGPIFDSGKFTCFCDFGCCWSHYFYSVFSEALHLLSPENSGTRSVNTTALNEKNGMCFCIFCFSVFAASGFFSLFWEEWKTYLLCPLSLAFFERSEKRKAKIKYKTAKKEQDHKMQTRNHLVLLHKKKKENRRHRDKAIQLHCLDRKQTTQGNKKTPEQNRKT